METPEGALGQPMRIEIGEQQCGLEEHQAGDPYRGRAAKGGQKLPGGDGLNEKEKERAKKDGGGEEDSSGVLRRGGVWSHRNGATWVDSVCFCRV